MTEQVQDEFNQAIHKLVMEQAGQMQAQALRVTNAALLGTLMKSLPPLLPVLVDNLTTLAQPGAAGLDDASIPAYAAAIEEQLAHLKVYE